MRGETVKSDVVGNIPVSFCGLPRMCTQKQAAAILQVHADTLQKFFRADPEARDEVGCTPLQKASRRGHCGAVLVLLQRGVEVNSLDRESRSPLHRAALRGHPEVAELLLENGADVNKMDRDGNTPLSWAVALDHEEVVKVLIASGAEC